MKQIKRTAEQKRLQIAERLRQEPNLSNRAVGRQLSVSPHTVADVRNILGIKRPITCVNAQGGTVGYDWLNDPWILDNPSIIDSIRTPRALRAIKSSPEVIKVMQERNVGAVRAQQIINLQIKANLKDINGITIDNKNIIIRKDDIMTGLSWIPDQSCDIICVDPPYAKKYINLYEAISRVASRILKPNGHLLILTGCSHLPAIMMAVERGANKTNLIYKWTMSVQLPRSSPTSVMFKGVMTGWKPIIIYKMKGPKIVKPALVYDVLNAIDQDDKSLHHWQQSELVFTELLYLYKTNNSDFVVADICCGSGTTITSAIKIGATAVYACDIDAKSVATTKKRINKVMYGKE
jgi:16S rRNA G966 N2-methylase RsmD